jgi:hypothetical protein
MYLAQLLSVSLMPSRMAVDHWDAAGLPPCGVPPLDLPDLGLPPCGDLDRLMTLPSSIPACTVLRLNDCMAHAVAQGDVHWLSAKVMQQPDRPDTLETVTAKSSGGSHWRPYPGGAQSFSSPAPRCTAA